MVKEALQQKKWQNLSKTDQFVKTNIFETLKFLRSENSKLMKVVYTSEDYAQKWAEFSDVSVIIYNLYSGRQKSVSAQELNFNINFRIEP